MSLFNAIKNVISGPAVSASSAPGGGPFNPSEKTKVSVPTPEAPPAGEDPDVIQFSRPEFIAAHWHNGQIRVDRPMDVSPPVVTQVLERTKKTFGGVLLPDEKAENSTLLTQDNSLVALQERLGAEVGTRVFLSQMEDTKGLLQDGHPHIHDKAAVAASLRARIQAASRARQEIAVKVAEIKRRGCSRLREGARLELKELYATEIKESTRWAIPYSPSEAVRQLAYLFAFACERPVKDLQPYSPCPPMRAESELWQHWTRQNNPTQPTLRELELAAAEKRQAAKLQGSEDDPKVQAAKHAAQVAEMNKLHDLIREKKPLPPKK